MAQRKPRTEKDEIEAREVKLRRLFDKRNELNETARDAREQRNQLNDARAKIVEGTKKLRDERDALNAKMREHKERRNAFQQQAKGLIATKQGLRGKLPNEARARLTALERQIQQMEMEHATHPMSVEKERTFLDKLRALTAEAESLRETVAEGEHVSGRLDDVDAEIDRLFKLADDEHKLVVELSEQAQAIHDRIAPAFEDADQLRAKADAVHQEAVALQERANTYHEKAVALIGELEEVRGEKRAERDEIDRVLAEQKAAANEALEPDDEVYDAFLDKLKKGEKLEF